MITLIIVDCQNDFISGTVRIKGASTILENIKNFIKNNKSKLSDIIFTVDWHPFNHCSFKKNGGNSVVHCVQFTPGSCIEPKLLKFVQSYNIKYQVSIKGDVSYFEQQGAFEDIDYLEDGTGSRYYFDSIVEANASNDFVICGISGDYSVKHTIQNLLSGGIVPKVFLSGIISADDGKIFNRFIEETNLEIVE